MKRILIFIFCILLLTSCSKKKDDVQTYTQITGFDQLNNKNIGIVAGSVSDVYIKESFPDSKIVYFNSRAEILLGLRNNKIDAFTEDGPIADLFDRQYDDIKCLDEVLFTFDTAFCFSKDANTIKDEFNIFLAEYKKNGHLNELTNKWVDNFDDSTRIEEREFSGENGVLNIITSIDCVPFSFIADGTYQGYETELIYDFCTYAGYTPNIQNCNFDALLTSISTNKFDVGYTCVTVTPEREKNVDFSDTTYVTEMKVLVLDHDGNNFGEVTNGSNGNFFDNIKYKFNQMFFEQDRWRLILNGILTTIVITLLSLLFGTLFGFVFYMISWKTPKIIKKIFDVLSFVISRIPVVVILMILFYVIFVDSKISGVSISIVGFSLITSLSIYSMLDNGISAIDIGQTEAGLALGYSDNQTLFKFILPQALKIVMPSYKGEIVSLIKSSSIVGYVTVQDLTRVSDIIRSSTYEAFFPLIMTAIIYFFLAWILSYTADKLQNRFLPNQKTKKAIKRKYGIK